MARARVNNKDGEPFTSRVSLIFLGGIIVRERVSGFGCAGSSSLLFFHEEARRRVAYRSRRECSFQYLSSDPPETLSCADEVGATDRYSYGITG